MSAPACERIDDAAVYVLRAMEEGRWQEYQTHCALCHACAEKVRELRGVAHALLNAVPQMSAPGALRHSIMAIVRGEAELLSAAGPTADRPAPVSHARPRRAFMLRPWPAIALASAVLALGVAGGARLVGSPEQSRTIVGFAPGPATARVEQYGDDRAKLLVAKMPDPPRGRIYQVWLDHGGGRAPEPTNALFSVRHGTASVDVPGGELGPVKRVLVTDEPLGGSQAPTGKLVVNVKLS